MLLARARRDGLCRGGLRRGVVRPEAVRLGRLLCAPVAPSAAAAARGVVGRGRGTQPYPRLGVGAMSERRDVLMVL
jgi:hypothetical protein